MPAKAELGVSADLSELNSAFEGAIKLLTSLAQMSEKAGGSLATSFSAAQSKVLQSATDTEHKVQQLQKESVDRATSAAQAKAAAKERFDKLEVEYEHKKDKDIYEAIRKLKEEKEEIQNAMAVTTDKNAKKELASEKASIDAQIRDLKRLQEEKEHNLSLPGKIAHAGKNFLLGEGGTGEVGGGLVSGGAMGGMLGNTMALGGMATGVAGVTMALEKLFDAGKEAKEREEEISIGLRTMGMSAEDAEKATQKVVKSSKDVGTELALNHVEVEKATAAYLKMGGSTDNLKQKQEDIAALAKRAGIDMETAAKQYAMAGDPEVAKSLSRVGIVLDKNMTAAERSAKIHEKLAGTLEGMKDAANGPLGAFNKLKDLSDQLMESLGGVVFGVAAPFINIASSLFQTLQPVIDVISDLGKIVGDVATSVFAPFTDIVKKIGDIFQFITPVLKIVAQVIGGALKLAIEVILAPIKFLISLWTDYIDGIINGIKYLGEVSGAFDWVSKAVSTVIEWFDKAVAAVKSVGSTILSLIGINTDEKKSTEENTEALEKSKKAREEEAEATKKQTEAGDAYLDSLNKQHEEEVKGIKDVGDKALAAVRDIDDKIAGRKKMGENETQASLLALRKDWVERSRQYAAESDRVQAEDHQRAVELGWATDDENAKKKKDTTKKDAKDLYNALKQEEDNNYAKTKAENLQRLLDHELTRKQYQEKELQDQIAHEEAINNIPNNAKFSEKQRAAIMKTHAGDILGATTALNNDKLKLQDDAYKKELDALNLFFEKEDTQVALQVATGELQEKDAAHIRRKNEQDKYDQLIRIAEQYGMDTTQLEQQRDKAVQAQVLEDAKRLLDIKKNTIKEQNEIVESSNRAYLDGITNKNLKEELTEQAAYEKKRADKLAQLKTEGVDQQTANAAMQMLEIEHQAKLSEIRRKNQEQQLQFLSGPLVNAYQQGMQQLDEKFFKPMQGRWFSQKTFAGQALSTITDGFIKMGEEMLMQAAGNLAKSIIFGTTSAAATTAAMEAVTAAATPAATAVSIASFGAADAAGTAGMLTSLASTKAAYTIAGKFAEGGVALGPSFFVNPYGLNVTGEAGPEMHIPLNRYPGIEEMGKGGFEQHANRIVSAVEQMGHQVSSTIRQTPPVLPMGAHFESSRNQGLYYERNRSL